MSYSVSDLKPKNPVLIIDSHRIELSLITLQKDVIFADLYGNIAGVFDELSKKPTEIIPIIYELVADKSQFKFSIEVFKKFIFNLNATTDIVAKEFTRGLHESVNKSMPIIKNEKRYKELQEINQSTTMDAPCYASYFDTVASRYGYTLEQFYQLTLRQLHILLTTIGDKKYDELEVQAALQGRQLKPRITFNDVSIEEEEDQEKQAQDALAELKRKYQERKKEDGK